MHADTWWIDLQLHMYCFSETLVDSSYIKYMHNEIVFQIIL